MIILDPYLYESDVRQEMEDKGKSCLNQQELS